MSVTVATVTIPAGSETVQLFDPVEAASQVTILYADDTAFLCDAAGVTPPYSSAPMPANMIGLPDPSNTPLQFNLAAGDTLYIAPYQGEPDLHIGYVITS